MSIYDGANKNDVSIANWDGNHNPPPTSSSGPNLLLMFRSGEAHSHSHGSHGAHSGFSISYHTEGKTTQFVCVHMDIF